MPETPRPGERALEAKRARQQQREPQKQPPEPELDDTELTESDVEQLEHDDF